MQHLCSPFMLARGTSSSSSVISSLTAAAALSSAPPRTAATAGGAPVTALITVSGDTGPAGFPPGVTGGLSAGVTVSLPDSANIL